MRTRHPGARGALLLVLLGCLLGPLSACSGREPAAPARFERYVALGDSYVAAPGVPTLHGPAGCGRSTGNYPSQLARALPVRTLVDRSCGGATTQDLTGRQSDALGERQPPQLAALDEDTDLVTLGIGGNDVGLLGVLAGACSSLARAQPDGAPCRDAFGAQLIESGRAFSARLGRVIERIHAASPRARVLVVGYPQVVSATHFCADVPLAKGDYAFAREVIDGLNAVLAEQAEAHDATYVHVADRTAGHEICTPDPWINGARSTGEAAAYHPFRREQQAVAEAVMSALAG